MLDASKHCWYSILEWQRTRQHVYTHHQPDGAWRCLSASGDGRPVSGDHEGHKNWLEHLTTNMHTQQAIQNSGSVYCSSQGSATTALTTS